MARGLKQKPREEPVPEKTRDWSRRSSLGQPQRVTVRPAGSRVLIPALKTPGDVVKNRIPVSCDRPSHQRLEVSSRPPLASDPGPVWGTPPPTAPSLTWFPARGAARRSSRPLSCLFAPLPWPTWPFIEKEKQNSPRAELSSHPQDRARVPGPPHQPHQREGRTRRDDTGLSGIPVRGCFSLEKYVSIDCLHNMAFHPTIVWRFPRIF